MTAPAADTAFRALQLARFDLSVLKQAKWRALSRAAGDTRGLRALDLGTDNGVIGLLFRLRGGQWSSGDRTDDSVGTIRRVLGEEVVRLQDERLPFPDASFDLVIVADLMEHLADDRGFLREIARCLRAGGRAVVNVPRLKPWGVLRPVRRVLGLTDAWHGHLHAGYDEQSLRALLPPSMRLEETREYVRFFSYALDTALNAANRRASASDERPASASVRRAYPFMRAFAALDALIPFTHGYMLVATLERIPDATES
jgi:SAM-dependent methyltransferase